MIHKKAVRFLVLYYGLFKELVAFAICPRVMHLAPELILFSIMSSLGTWKRKKKLVG